MITFGLLIHFPYNYFQTRRAISSPRLQRPFQITYTFLVDDSAIACATHQQLILCVYRFPTYPLVPPWNTRHKMSPLVKSEKRVRPFPPVNSLRILRASTREGMRAKKR